MFVSSEVGKNDVLWGFSETVECWNAGILEVWNVGELEERWGRGISRFEVVVVGMWHVACGNLNCGIQDLACGMWHVNLGFEALFWGWEWRTDWYGRKRKRQAYADIRAVPSQELLRYISITRIAYEVFLYHQWSWRRGQAVANGW